MKVLISLVGEPTGPAESDNILENSLKKLLLSLLLIGAGMGACTVQAEAHGYYGYRGGYYGGGWVAPALIGGVVGYSLARPYYAPPPPVVYVQPPVYIQQPQIVQEAPVGYHWQMMIDPNTNQQRPVLVPN